MKLTDIEERHTLLTNLQLKDLASVFMLRNKIKYEMILIREQNVLKNINGLGIEFPKLRLKGK